MKYGIDNHISVSPMFETPILTHVKRSPRKLSLRTFMHDSSYNHRPEVYEQDGNYAPEAVVDTMLNEYVHSAREVRHPAIMKFVQGEWLDSRYEGELFVYLGGSCLDLDHPELERELRDKTLFAFNLDILSRPFNVVNVYPISSDTECGRHRVQERQNTTHLAQVRLPFRDSNLDEGVIRIYVHPDHLPIGDYDNPIICDQDYYDAVKGRSEKTRCNGFPRLEMKGPARLKENHSADLHIRLTNYSGDTITGKPVKVYLESNTGYLPHRQVVIDPVTGSATARVQALGMYKNESMKVKCGFKFYSGADSLFIKVT